MKTFRAVRARAPARSASPGENAQQRRCSFLTTACFVLPVVEQLLNGGILCVFRLDEPRGEHGLGEMEQVIGAALAGLATTAGRATVDRRPQLLKPRPA